MARLVILAFVFINSLPSLIAQIDTPCDEIFFSEYIEGSSNNKCVEIFNGTGSTVDLSNYSIRIYFGGNTTIGDNIQLDGMLLTGNVYVVCHSSAADGFLAEADQTTGALRYNGDDAVELVNGITTIDVIGVIGEDPGSEWGSGDASTQNNTIRRKSFVNMGDSDGSDDPSIEWDGYPSNNLDDLGDHTSLDCDPCRDLMIAVNAAATATELCEGEDIELFEDAGNLAIDEWEWVGPDGFISPMQNPVIPMATMIASGTYTVTGTEPQLGCIATSSIDIMVNAFPEAPMVQDLAVCEGESTLIDLSGFINPPAVTSFNFYDTDPSGGGAVPVAAMVDMYDPGASGTFYVTALSGICEGPPSTLEVILSQGFQPLNCDDHLNLSLGAGECTLEITPEMMVEGEGIMFEFISIKLVDEAGHEIPGAILDVSHIGQTITVSIIDICNENSCWGTISLEDKMPPLIDAPDIMVECGTDTSVEALNNITITDCSYFTRRIKDVELGDICGGDRRIERIITATDDHGNTSVHTQVISFKALSLDVVTAPNSVVTTTCGVISMPDIYAYTGVIEDAYPTLNGEPLFPGEFCNFLVGKTDEIVEACDLSCSNSVKVIRQWKIYDWCNLNQPPLIFEQLISAKDQEAPVIYPFVEIDTFSIDPWSCVVENLILPQPNATDNCTPNALIYDIYNPDGIAVVDGVAKNVPVGKHEFIYTATDCCGNVSDPQSVIVAVLDLAKPVAIAKQKIVLSLTYDINEDDGSAKLYAESVDNGSYDNCSPVTLRVRRESDPCRADSDEYGPFVKFCCRDVGDTIKVWLEVRDTSGNYNETWANVLIEDKFAVIECTDVYIECHDNINETISANRPEAYGTCRSKRVEELDRDYTYFDETCHRGIIYVTWGVRDLEHITCVQAIYVNYETSLVCDDIDWPDAYSETDCMDLEPYELTWEADLCDLIGWTLVSDTFSFSSGSCSKIVNNYIVIDWCAFDSYMNEPVWIAEGFFESQNDLYDGIICEDPDLITTDLRSSPTGVYNYIEVIKLVDDIAPEILLCDYDPFLITSGCSTPVTISNIGVDNSGCPNTLLTWDLTLTTEDGYIYTYRTRSSSGEVVNIELVDEDGDPLQFYGPMSTHHIKLVLSDGCGNVDKCETTFMTVDRKDPTPYCVHLSSAVMENGQVELWARDFDIGSFDNCSEKDSLLFTFDEIAPAEDLLYQVHYFDESGLVDSDIEERYAAGEIQKWNPDKKSAAKVFTCDDIPSVTFGMSIWDEKFNTDYCEVTLDLVDNQDACPEPLIADISGTILTKDNEGIDEVDVLIENIGDGSQLSTATNVFGSYAFRALPMFENYEITPSKKGDIVDGLSTEDVLLIQKFIMDENVFTSPYDIIASDLNNDKRISATDIILLQRIIIGQLTELKDGIWKFVDAKQELTFDNALADYRSNFSVTNLVEDFVTTDFIGIKMGDVTGDASTSARDGGATTRTNNVSIVQIEDMYVTEGEIVEIPVIIPEFTDLVGYQMTITLNDAIVVDVDSGSTPLYASNVGRISDQIIALSYADIRNMPSTDHIFSLNIQVGKSGKLSELIDINDQYLKSEAYHGLDVVPSYIVLEFIEPVTSDDLFTVEQNTPNPFSNETVIRFSMPETAPVALSVYNVSGQLIHHINREFYSGKNEITLDNHDLDFSNGVLYYRMTYKDQSITRKMIVIE